MSEVEVKDLYVSSFQKLGPAITGKDAAWLRKLREKALASFAETGFPTIKDEYWKYTDLSTNFLKVSFGFEAETTTQTAMLAKLKSMGYNTDQARLVVFVNGHFSKELSVLKALPKGVKLQSMAAALAGDPSLSLHQILPFENRAFTALNAAYFTDGLFLNVPQGQILSEPVHVVYLSTNGNKTTQSHVHNLVLMEDDSKDTLIEHYLGDAVSPYLTNVVTEVRLSRGASLEHVKIQEESEKAYHIGTLAVKQEEGSRLVSRLFSSGGFLARNEVQTALTDKKAECSLEGLYLIKGKQHTDTRTFIDHISPACKSEEFFKGILDGEGTGILDGHIIVRENAQKTDARQTTHNLQLSNATKVYSKPQLHIYADDVKCSHGSATGQLAEEALFYFQSRGVGREEAKRILVSAFAEEMVNRVSSDYLKAPLRKMVEEWLKGSTP